MKQNPEELSLFSTNLNPQEGGFRLKKLQLYNWGTFDSKIWSISPECGDTLLTGENGSGKSTIVDAIITLLIKPRKRSYNLSSGANRKERSEESYAKGAWGKNVDEEQRERTRFLRDKGDQYSIILANFYNAATLSNIGLGQFFWLEQGKLKKFYFQTIENTNLADYFFKITSVKALKKRLRKSDIFTLFDTFREYEENFCRLFELKSGNALDIFNQIVSIKDIRDLNHFIRSYMLEKMDLDDDLEKLYVNYNNLTLAHLAIVKAKNQLQELIPIAEDAEKFINNETTRDKYGQIEQILVPVVAIKRIEILQQSKSEIIKGLHLVHEQIERADEKKKSLENQRRDLEVALANDQTWQQIKNIEEKIERHQRDRAEKKIAYDNFSSIVKALEQSFKGDLKSFSSILEQLERDEKKWRDDETKQQEKLLVLHSNRQELVKKRDSESNELRSLKRRQNLIPERSISIRQQISDNLDIPISELPFIGELLQVKQEEFQWEGAIERLLKNFALRMLVPDIHYAKINKYVNQNDLKGRLVYQKIDLICEYATARAVTKDELITKLEIHPESRYCDWLHTRLLKDYDYICSDNMARLSRETKAITSKGLIKRNLSLHEKDDRWNIFDRMNYILGWSNQKKIMLLEQSVKELSQQINAIESTISNVNKKKEQIKFKLEAAIKIKTFKSFQQMDWIHQNSMIADLENQIEILRPKDRTSQVQEEITRLTDKLSKLNRNRDALITQKGSFDAKFDQVESLIEEDLEKIAGFTSTGVEKYVSLVNFQLEKYLKNNTLTDPSNLHKMEEKVREFYRNELIKCMEKSSSLGQILSKRMEKFINTHPEESSDLHSGSEYVDDFLAMKNRLEIEDLPRHELRFRELLNKNLVQDIASYKGHLDAFEENIKENIASLNHSLGRIKYTNSTYVNIESRRNVDPEIIDFRAQLRNCLPDVGLSGEKSSYEESFFRIKKLLEILKSRERWRKKVTDVRNWLDFSITERYFQDKVIKNSYSDSGGLSGGQKAKLAFTILGSAISYQYGLTRDGDNAKTFRFAVIDEAFSKSDDINSHYLMTLFKELNLQLMVITPRDKIHVAESYIEKIFLVTNNEEMNDSQVFEVEMDKLKEVKENKE